MRSRHSNTFSREPLASAGPALARGSRLNENKRRGAFTLIELVVVVVIIVILAALGVLVLPRLLDQERASEGAAQVQSWLLLAKQKALRDQAPRGIRIILDPNSNGAYASQLQYIEQPEDFTGGTIVQAAGTVVQFSGVDFTGGSTNQGLYLVQAGDYLEIKGGGMVYQIQTVSNATTLQLSSAPASVPAGTWQYRIIRQPRVLAGEDPLELPVGVGIDMTLSMGDLIPKTGMSSLMTAGYFDILFSPSGIVIGSGSAYNKVNLWVRDITSPQGTGDETLITVYSRTGLIAANPVDAANTANPYDFTTDGRSSGE